MSRIVAAFDSFWFCGLIRAPTDPNCLLISAAAKNAAGDMQAAQSTMQRLLKADLSFSLADERTYRRFSLDRAVPGSACQSQGAGNQEQRSYRIERRQSQHELTYCPGMPLPVLVPPP